jgi:hypothetical protein
MADAQAQVQALSMCLKQRGIDAIVGGAGGQTNQ